MSWQEFWVILACVSVTMLACRTLPLFLLKGRELSPAVSRALSLIPPAVFAALVANDILSPGMFSEGIWPASAIIAASLCVMVVAVRTKSLIWSAVVGVAAYALLLAI